MASAQPKQKEKQSHSAVMKPVICGYVDFWDMNFDPEITNPEAVPIDLLTYMQQCICYESIYNGIIKNIQNLKIREPHTVIDVGQNNVLDTIYDAIKKVLLIIFNLHEFFEGHSLTEIPFSLPSKNPENGMPTSITVHIQFYHKPNNPHYIYSRIKVLYNNSIGEWADVFTMEIHPRL